ncbi:MAG: hypothetical protein WAV31_04135 [Candidatus Moraniibacteriota bacterium]
MNKKLIASFLVLIVSVFFLVGSAKAVCTDSDGGNKPFIQGNTDFNGTPTKADDAWDNCVGNNLTEYFCTGGALDQSVNSCTSFYEDAYCKASEGRCDMICVDSDSKDYSTQGYVEFNPYKDSAWDNCVDTNTVKEYYCSADKKLSEDIHACGSGKVCAEGKCADSFPEPSCNDYSYDTNSGAAITVMFSATHADKVSWVCSNFRCSGGTCNDDESYSYSGNTDIPSDGTITNSIIFNNDSGKDLSRNCKFTVWSSANSSVKRTCNGNVNVHSGAVVTPPPPDGPSCVYSTDGTIDSGKTAQTHLTTSNAQEVSWTCSDFNCTSGTCYYEDNYDYNSPVYTLPLADNSATFYYYNTSGSLKTRSCTITVKNTFNNKTATCGGGVSVRSGDEPPQIGDGPTCAYDSNDSIVNSGEIADASVSAWNANRIKYTCNKFECTDRVCTYDSPAYFYNSLTYPIEQSLDATALYYNNSGDDQTRSCNFKVWNTLNPSVIGSCSGAVTVRSCDGCGGCTPFYCNACLGFDCWNGCGYTAGTEDCSSVTCGNGIIEGSEICDDGANNGVCPKTCSATCTSNTCGGATCGNGVLEGVETCDNGANNGVCPKICSTSCTSNTCSVCGNGILELGELCDKGANNGVCPKTCSAGCTFNNCDVCGDGIKGLFEDCDNGVNNGGCPETCSSSCRTNVCSPGNWEER